MKIISKFRLPFTFLLCIFVLKTGFSQFNFIYDDSTIPVIKGSDTLSLAWAGGMDHPQFSTIDLDFDGVDELVAFEPYGHAKGVVTVFKRKIVEGKLTFQYWHKGNELFPSDLRFKMKLVDYDGDGKKDLFTYTPGGIKVYKNIGTLTNGIQWQLIVDPILAFDGTLTSNLYASANEIPAYYDVDGDGDVDILAFALGVKRVVWYKNLSMETYGHADSLIFEIEQPCWGDFVENGSGNGIDLNSTVPPCGTSGIPQVPNYSVRHQGGGSIMAFDVNDDGLADVIIGDNDYNNVTLVVNGGTVPQDNALMDSIDANYPSTDVSIDLPTFVTTYYEDVDMDGVKDLIASTTELSLKTSENTRGVWFYKNNGTDDLPDFVFQTEGFLQNDMIENGSGSIPLLVDINNDGLIDLLIANDFNYLNDGNLFSPNSSQINYYENVGTPTNPVFKLNKKDWNSFSNSGYPARISPTFGDLDGEGDKDMITGTKNGRLYYYENSGGTGAMNFSIAQYQLMDNNGDFITVSNYATPELFDLDGDGKLDLIIGQGNGPILFYRNIGTSTSFSFQLENTDLGGIGATINKAVPRFTRHNDTTYMIVGSEDGTLSFFDDIDGNIAQGDNFHLISSTYLGIDTKEVSAPIIGQLRNDNSYDLFVGGRLGGLWSYRPGDTTFLETIAYDDKESIMPQIAVFPNPNKGDFKLRVTDLKGQKYNYRVVDPLGRVLIDKKQEYKSEINIRLKNPESGFYFIEVNTFNNQRRVVKKLLVK